MDSLITAAARALAIGDLVGVLKRVGLRDDAPALALRGIAMAQLGDFARARELLQSAARAFGPREAVARARCVVAEAEIALVSRDLTWQPRALGAAREMLESRGDWVNAAHARHLEIRRLLLLGRLDEAGRSLEAMDPAPLPPAFKAGHDMIVAAIAVRRLRATEARAALIRAARDAHLSRNTALIAEIAHAQSVLESPAARMIGNGSERLLILAEVEVLFSSATLVVDACRRIVCGGDTVISLAGRPILFALARALAAAWPGEVTRQVLIERVFRTRRFDESHRVRLRVEMGRLRVALRAAATVNATAGGFALTPCQAGTVVVLAPPVENQHATLLALLVDGEAWSSTALALALGSGPRTVQRALKSLLGESKVQSFGRGRTRRWTAAPPLGFTTSLLLPGPLPSD